MIRRGADRALGRVGQVLNARRHRDGDQRLDRGDDAPIVVCSTPGGIETVIRCRLG